MGRTKQVKAAYRHDHHDRHTDLNAPGNPDLAIRFSYDAFGRRTLKEVRYPNGRIERTIFTWDGNTLLLEERFEQPVMTREEHIAQVMQRPAPLEVVCEYPPDSDPLPVAQRQHQLDTSQWRGMSIYLYEPDTFTPLARLEQTLEEPTHITLGPDGEFTEHPVKTKHATYFYQNDHLGTPQELVDEQGEIVWLGKYRAWGELRSATQKDGQPAKIRNALRFQGQYCDDETGLHYNLNRYYDPQAGRFINKDPIGLEGGINLFQYAQNPILWTDPLGLAACKCDPCGKYEVGPYNDLKNRSQPGDGLDIHMQCRNIQLDRLFLATIHKLGLRLLCLQANMGRFQRSRATTLARREICWPRTSKRSGSIRMHRMDVCRS